MPFLPFSPLAFNVRKASPKVLTLSVFLSTPVQLLLINPIVFSNIPLAPFSPAIAIPNLTAPPTPLPNY